MKPTSLAVIGGGYAGVLAANRAAAQGLNVTLVNDRDVMVDRIRLHEVIAGNRSPACATRPIRSRTVRLIVARATHIDEGAVVLDDGRVVTADHVLIATGSVHGIGSLPWAMAHRNAVAHLRPGQTVQVSGAGLTGLETAAELAETRPSLRVVLTDPRGIDLDLTDRATAHLERTLDRLGIQVSTTVQSADQTIPCTGFDGDPLARDSGMPSTEGGTVIVDRHLRVHGQERIWGCGDAVRVGDQDHLRMGCASAEPMAAHVADNIARAARGEPTSPLSLGYAMRCISLGRHDGLIQFVRPDDSPRPQVLTGRAAAAVKELICRGAAQAPLRWSRFYAGLEGP